MSAKVSPDMSLEGGIGAVIVILNSNLDPLPFELSISVGFPHMPSDLKSE